MRIDKKIILIIITSFLCISCMENELNFELKIKSRYENFSEEESSDIDTKKNEILLSCRKDNCKIYENDKMVNNRNVNRYEIKKIKKLLNKIIKKSENIFIASNSITKININRKEYIIPYIIEEEIELLNIFSYKNKILISDEEYHNSKRFLFRALNEFGSQWEIFCGENKCKILYYPNNLDKAERVWEIKKLETEILQNKLMDAINNKYEETLYNEQNYELILDNGKKYHNKIEKGKFKKILNELIQEDYKNIEKKYLGY
ncbi:hypothetical protein [Pseudoleptotrichia goodfellowii]|uniref:Uncharacterized protein n=1 Tax=Pseudoleptotrichia goodfellowii TaxID=157692 RepID=A0A510J8Q2_9FUSO|nr:hypothetical protein [Pseudoleptotrichia goodfellowii]BBM35544.1 hypothetical protein JCM16774_0469 [Pseudoleptotrichia goodfellowii]